MAVTISDIAEKCKLSRSAVAQVLRNPENSHFPETTRDKILDAAKNLKYVRNTVAEQLRKGKTQTLSLVLRYTVPELIDTAEPFARSLGYRLSIQFAKSESCGSEQRELINALEHKVDGIIWEPVFSPMDYIQGKERVENVDTPLALYGMGLPQFPDADVVQNDTVRSCDDVIGHLIHQGYRSLVLVGYTDDEKTQKQLIDPFRNIAISHGIKSGWIPGSPIKGEAEVIEKKSKGIKYDLDSSLVKLSQRGIAIGTFEERVSQYLDTVDKPVAFYCSSDWLSVHVMEAAASKGLSVPDDVGVVSMGDYLLGTEFRLGQLTSPKLTAVCRPHDAMIRRAIEALVERIEGKRKGPGEHILVPMDFNIRQSSVRNGNK